MLAELTNLFAYLVLVLALTPACEGFTLKMGKSDPLMEILCGVKY
jgi:hypothetical protein